MQRSKRQLARVREAQTSNPPLTPDLYAPVTTQKPVEVVCPTCEGRITAELLEARYFVRCAERDRDAVEKKLVEERAAMQARYVEMQSENEALKQKVVALANLGRDFNKVDTAEARKAAVLADVVNGKFCSNAAAPADAIKAEASAKLERIESQCQSNL